MLKFKTISLLTIIVLIALFSFSFYTEFSVFWYIFVLLIWLVITIIGSFSMHWNFHLKAFTSNATIESKKIAITFDDGPNSEFTQPVLKLLERFNAKATFFCIGKHVVEHPKTVKQISKQGHVIGNHSNSHGYFIDFNSTKKWLEEIQSTDEKIKSITGEKPILFRPPFGVTTPHLANAIKTTKHIVVGWNNRPFDTVIKNKDIVLKRIIKNVNSGSVILLHDTQPNILYILEHLLLYLQQQNYEMVTVNDLYNGQ